MKVHLCNKNIDIFGFSILWNAVQAQVVESLVLSNRWANKNFCWCFNYIIEVVAIILGSVRTSSELRT